MEATDQEGPNSHDSYRVWMRGGTGVLLAGVDWRLNKVFLQGFTWAGAKAQESCGRAQIPGHSWTSGVTDSTERVAVHEIHLGKADGDAAADGLRGLEDSLGRDSSRRTTEGRSSFFLRLVEERRIARPSRAGKSQALQHGALQLYWTEIDTEGT